MILRNKKTNKTLRITRREFFKRFANEISLAITEFQKENSINISNNCIGTNLITLNFFSGIDFNFNNYSNSNWLIERF